MATQGSGSKGKAKGAARSGAAARGGSGGGGGGGGPAARIDALIAEIRRHDRLYYELDQPVLADAEYDALFAELAALEAAHPDLARPDSPTRRVAGAPVSHLVSVEHRTPMLSLANTYSRDEVVDWRDSIADYLKLEGKARDALTFALEPKLDGVAIELVYERGALTAAITRAPICDAH